MKTMKLKTATQVALENTRQELKDIKAAAKRAAVDLKKAGVPAYVQSRAD